MSLAIGARSTSLLCPALIALPLCGEIIAPLCPALIAPLGGEIIAGEIKVCLFAKRDAWRRGACCHCYQCVLMSYYFAIAMTLACDFGKVCHQRML